MSAIKKCNINVINDFVKPKQWEYSGCIQHYLVCKIAGDLKEMLKILRTFACQELDE